MHNTQIAGHYLVAVWLPAITESLTEFCLMEKVHQQEGGGGVEREITVTHLSFFLVLIFKSIDCCSEHAKLLGLAETELWR